MVPEGSRPAFPMGRPGAGGVLQEQLASLAPRELEEPTQMHFLHSDTVIVPTKGTRGSKGLPLEPHRISYSFLEHQESNNLLHSTPPPGSGQDMKQTGKEVPIGNEQWR